MHGARQFARDYLAPHIGGGRVRLLDLGCGDKWIFSEFHEPLALYCGVDTKTGTDLTKDEWIDKHPERAEWNLLVSCYALQHLLHEEARVWTLLRRIARPDTKFVYIGSHRRIADRNWKRGDPCNRHSLGTLEGLALASGWKIVDFTRATYTADGYTRGDGGEENALAATLAPRGEGE